MKEILSRFLSSYRTTILLLFIYALTMALATVLEKYYGTPFAKAMVYYSPLFFLMHILMVINFILTTIKHHLFKKKKWSYLITHCSFIIILLGAFITFAFGKEGIMHIREGETSNQMLISLEQEDLIEELPFSLELEEFILTRYPGSQSPSSYESKLLVHVDGQTRKAHVYMNNVLDVKGYRFFQASYDQDEQGTILSVNQDVMGRRISYTGYALLFFGLISCFFDKTSRFSHLNRLLKTKYIKVSCMLVLGLGLGVTPSKAISNLHYTEKIPVIPNKHAKLFGSLAMQSNKGRIVPINTFSSEILRKISKKNTIDKLNSDQFLLSLICMPEKWIEVPLITIGNDEIASYLRIARSKMSYIEAFDTQGNYILIEQVQQAYLKSPAQRTRWDKDLLKLDEKVNILHQLFNKQLLKIYPLKNDDNHRWFAAGENLSQFSKDEARSIVHLSKQYIESVLSAIHSGDWIKADNNLLLIKNYQESNSSLELSSKKLQAEVSYNQLNIFNQCKKAYLILGGLLLILALVSLLKQQKSWMRQTHKTLTVLVLLTFLIHTLGMAIRGYVAGYAPWSNSYETMVYIAWTAVLGGLIFSKHNLSTFALATLLAGVVLFVSSLNWMDPQINPLVPVLKSPWLMFHVAVIVAAYGFFGISCMISLTNLSLIALLNTKTQTKLSSKIKELSIINEMLLITGLILMTIGTFLGAIWANESWGRYWGWDPKETWALITMIVYAVVLHLRLVKTHRLNIWLFNITALLAFSTVLMTYFGVNYLLSGMHSYGHSDVSSYATWYILIAVIVILSLALVSYKKKPLLIK
ncbi:MAG: cytochrome c biogenesis protein CcsA [Bacteroides sp.]